MTTIIRSPYREGVSFSLPTSKLNPTLVLSVLLNKTEDGRHHFNLDVSQRPPDHEHARMIQWLSTIADRLDESLMRYCQAWIALILLHHLWCTPEDEARRALQAEVCSWISNRLHDSNTLRLDSMLFATSVMLSDEAIHASYVQQRNFSLASVGKLKKGFVMNADKVRELLKRAESQELTTAQLLQLAHTIEGGQPEEQQGNEREVQLIDDHDAESYSVLWTGGKRRVWVPKDGLRQGAAQWRAMADKYEQRCETLIEQATLPSTTDTVTTVALNEDTAQDRAAQNQQQEEVKEGVDEAASSRLLCNQNSAPRPAVIDDDDVNGAAQSSSAPSPLLLLTAVEGHQHDTTMSASTETPSSPSRRVVEADAPSLHDSINEALTREITVLRREVEELKLQAQLCAKAEAGKVTKLLNMNSALREDLRASELERQRLHRLLKQRASDTCSSSQPTLPSMLRHVKKRVSSTLEGGAHEAAEQGRKKQARELDSGSGVTRRLSTNDGGVSDGGSVHSHAPMSIGTLG